MNTAITQNTNYTECVTKLRELIFGIKVAMLTTLSSDAGQTGMHSRPMWTQDLEFDGSLWFFAAASSPKSLEILKSPQVALSYCDPEDNRYVAVTGRAELVLDRSQAEKLWKPIYQAWFPQGLDDPELALIRVSVEKAEYWDSPSNKLVQLAGFVKAKLTGEGGKPPLADHEKLDLTG